MQREEEAAGLKGASLPLFLAFCGLGGFPLIRGNLVWEFLAWEDLEKSPRHTHSQKPLCQKKVRVLTERARASACELGVEGSIWR